MALRSRQGFSVEHIKHRIPISPDIWWRRSKTLSPRVAQLSQMAVQGQPTWVRCFRRVKSGKIGGPTWTQPQVRFAFSVRTTESHVWPSSATRDGGLYRLMIIYTWYDSQDFFAKSARQLGFEPVRRHNFVCALHHHQTSALEKRASGVFCHKSIGRHDLPRLPRHACH